MGILGEIYKKTIVLSKEFPKFIVIIISSYHSLYKFITMAYTMGVAEDIVGPVQLDKRPAESDWGWQQRASHQNCGKGVAPIPNATRRWCGGCRLPHLQGSWIHTVSVNQVLSLLTLWECAMGGGGGGGATICTYIECRWLPEKRLK